MKKICLSLLLTFSLGLTLTAQVGVDCCAEIVFDAQTLEPIDASWEKYYPDLGHICSGDCPGQ